MRVLHGEAGLMSQSCDERSPPEKEHRAGGAAVEAELAAWTLLSFRAAQQLPIPCLEWQ